MAAMPTSARPTSYLAWRGGLVVLALSACRPSASVPSEGRPSEGRPPAGRLADAGAPRDSTADIEPDVAEASPPAGAVSAGGSITIDGPHERLLAPGRPIFFTLPGQPTALARPFRLVVHLHGMCGGPSYACGTWTKAAAGVGALVCPTGNATCGDTPTGPPSWEAASWTELVALMDRDLEASIATIARAVPDAWRRDDAVLTGYSRGGFAAPAIAARHPGRWPYLVLIEANAPLRAEALRKSGVRAVALVGGEWGTELAGLRKTERALVGEGFPARVFVMPRTGHPYSANIDAVMAEALAFVLAAEPPPG